MTEKILTGNALRDWDPPETKALYWAGAYQALAAATGAQGCKTKEAYDHHWQERRHAGTHALDCDWDRLTPEQRAWYSMGAAEALSDVLDALPDSVIEHHPGGLKSLQAARRRWIAENQKIGDDYARKAGLLK